MLCILFTSTFCPAPKLIGDPMTGMAIEETQEAVRSSSERISLLRRIGASPAMIKEPDLNWALGIHCVL